MLPHEPKSNDNHRLLLIIAALTITIAAIPLALKVSSASSSNPVSVSLVNASESRMSSNRWTSNGPDGGPISSLSVDPANTATIYAVASSGIFKSTNRGESWSASLIRGELRLMAIAPSSPNTLYAAGQGVFKSTNGGISWTAINNGLTIQDIPVYMTALAIDPTNASIVYAAGADVEVSGGYKAIYKSTDGGNRWSITKHSINQFAVHFALAVDPTNPNIVYAAGAIGAAGTFWRSNDGGRFWEIYYLGYDSSYIVRDLALDPHDPKIVYAANGRGVFKSSDAGVNWSLLNGELEFAASSILIDAGTIYAGTYSGGVFKGTSGGSWIPINGELSNLNVSALALDSQNTHTLYVGTNVGIFKSTTSGVSWNRTNAGLRSVNISPLIVDPGKAATIYAEESYRGEDLHRTYKSVNYGESWSSSDFYPRAFDPRSPDTIYAQLPDRDGLFKSIDGGAIWNATGLTNLRLNVVVIDPANSAIIYAGSYDGLFKSTDGGNNWSAVGNLVCPTAILFAPDNSQTLYAASAFDCDDYCVTVFKSTDGGVNWTQSDSGASFSYLGALTIDPQDANTLYAADGEVYKSVDAGKSWRKITNGLSGNFYYLAIDPVRGNIVYAGGSGVFKSIDGGASWQPFNEGLSDLNVNGLAIDTAGSFLHAATSSGVFDIELTVLEPNVIDDTQFFVRQHYRDFLNREADADGLNFWTGEIVGSSRVDLQACKLEYSIVSPK